ncbi:MAG: sulfatase-like hydrolase/transferase [Eubacteriales bacterium]
MNKKKPNILLILADQQRHDTIGATGNIHMITPNLDKLVEEGCLFQNAYSSNPVCMPARHDLLMGMPSKAHGFFANCESGIIADHNVPTLPRILSENGYRTAAIGKMHFSPTKSHNGYGEMHLMEELPKCYQDDAYATYLHKEGVGEIANLHGVRPYIYHEPQMAQMDMEHYETSFISKRTIEWLDENGEEPFMLCVGYIKPHPPWDIPEEYVGIYQNKELPEAIERSRSYPNSQEHNGWYGDDDTAEQKRAIREAYYTAITMVDHSVGEIIEHLRESGQLDNTLVIYTADHGEMLQDKGYYSKELPYEGATHIPMIIRYPERFQQGTTRKDFVDLTDILPTCLDVSGVSYPTDQYNLYGGTMCENTDMFPKDREYVISATGFLGDKRFVMCRDVRYKYVYYYNQATEEMYDMVNDPEEVFNCIETMKDSDTYKRLKEQVVSYEMKWGPVGCVVDGQLCKIDGKVRKGYENGKYHIWSNHQFQNFTPLKGKERMVQFDKEFDRAFENKECPCKEPLWKEEYQKGRSEYENY